MSTLSRRRPVAALLCWLPVAGIVLALFVAPHSTGSAQLATLNVSPGSGRYGGEALVFSGDMGAGEQRIFLQRRGSPTGIWSSVVDPRTGKPFSRLTRSDGTFRFTFPAPAMNSVYFRLHSRSADTSAHLFRTKHQDAEIDLAESNPADVPLPRGIAVDGEAFRFSIDTVNTTDGKPTTPVLEGRQVTLQTRDLANNWVSEAQGEIGSNGKLTFGPYGPGASPQVAGVYRVRLEDWTEGGDNVGWFPSLPYYLKVVDRPEPVRGINAQATSTQVTLDWALQPDPVRDRIVIARTMWNLDPTAAIDKHILATLGPAATSYVDNAVYGGTKYNYAVYTRSADGVYNRVSTDISVTPPKEG